MANIKTPFWKSIYSAESLHTQWGETLPVPAQKRDHYISLAVQLARNSAPVQESNVDRSQRKAAEIVSQYTPIPAPAETPVTDPAIVAAAVQDIDAQAQARIDANAQSLSEGEFALDSMEFMAHQARENASRAREEYASNV